MDGDLSRAREFSPSPSFLSSVPCVCGAYVRELLERIMRSAEVAATLDRFIDGRRLNGRARAEGSVHE
jgi:hypothetical protein